MIRLALLTSSILLTSGVLGLSLPSSPMRVDEVSGVVREPSGAGVPAARVELRADDRILVATQTDATGAFRLTTSAVWSESWRLYVERLGYAPVEVAVPQGLGPIEIELFPAPLPLPGLVVQGDSDLCEARENVAARRIWDRVRLLHPGGLDTLGIASYTWMRTDTLGGGAVDRSTGMEGSAAGQRASASLLRESWTRRIEREGYAFPIRRSDRFRSYDSWSYPPLEADFSSHFVSESFGRIHDFHIETEDEYGWVLRFCGRRTNRPYLVGTLEIGPDSLIHRAEWEFVTGNPNENSGGWAAFPSSGPDGAAPYLLPIESLTWLSLPDSQVVRKAHWYQEWVMAPGDSVPFLTPSPRISAAEAPAEVPSAESGIPPSSDSLEAGTEL